MLIVAEKDIVEDSPDTEGAKILHNRSMMITFWVSSLIADWPTFENIIGFENKKNFSKN